jgi:hypothetical protein
MQEGTKYVKRAKEEIVAKQKLSGMQEKRDEGELVLEARCQGSSPADVYDVQVQLQAINGPQYDW